MGIIKKDENAAYSVGDKLYCMDCFAQTSEPEKGRLVTRSALEREEVERFCGVCQKMIFPGRMDPAVPRDLLSDDHGTKNNKSQG